METRSDKSDSTVEHAVRRGTRAVVVAQVCSQFISIAVLALLFRWLGPEPFGLWGMAFPALLLARMLAGFGLQVSVVQAKSLDSESRDRVFWMSQALGCAAALGMILAGPLLASLFGVPGLTPLCAGLALTLPLQALGSVHQGWWERQLAIGALAAVRVTAQLIGGVAALILAWRGAGVWALVGQQAIEFTCLAGIMWWASDWRPSLKNMKWHRDLFQFGSWYTGSLFLFYWAQNVDKFLLAWLLGMFPEGRVALGMYSQAYNLAMKPVLLVTTPLASVLIPGLAKLRDDRDRFSNLATRALSLASIVLIPAAVGIALVSSDVMSILGGGKWSSAAPILTMLCPLVAVQGLINLCGGVFAAKGKAKNLCWGALTQAIILTVTTVGLTVYAKNNEWTPQQVVLAMAGAISGATVCVIALPYLFFCATSVGIAMNKLVRPLWPIIIPTAVMGIVVAAWRAALADFAAPWLKLALSAGLGIAVYAYFLKDQLRLVYQEWCVPKKV